jgi:hypothetical protein
MEKYNVNAKGGGGQLLRLRAVGTVRHSLSGERVLRKSEKKDDSTSQPTLREAARSFYSELTSWQTTPGHDRGAGCGNITQHQSVTRRQRGGAEPLQRHCRPH